MALDGRRPDVIEGSGRVACRFRGLPLLPQAYTVWFGMKTSDNREFLVSTQEVASFSVVATGDEWGFRGELFHDTSGRAIPVVVAYDWVLPDGTVHSLELGKAPGRDWDDGPVGGSEALEDEEVEQG
jgi:hypothetical protein